MTVMNRPRDVDPLAAGGVMLFALACGGVWWVIGKVWAWLAG